MVFIGLDPSLTATGVVVISEDYQILHKDVLSTPIFGVERLYHLEVKLNKILDKYKKEPKFSAIERGAYKEEGRIFDLGEWSGVLKVNIFKREVDTIVVAPLQLKKYVTGKGVSKGKAVILLDIYKYWKEEFRDDNLADAYVLARICHDYYYTFRSKEEKNLNLKRYQVEVLKKIYEEHDKIKVVI